VPAALLALSYGRFVPAQTVKPATRLGITAGFNSSTFAGNDATDESRHSGGRVGGLVVIPMSMHFALQPELIYTTKGSEQHPNGDDLFFKMNFIELPILARFQMTPSHGQAPFFYAGPSIGHREACSFSGTALGGTYSCADVETLAGIKFNTWDAGVVVGLGVAFDVRGKTLSVSGRFDHGLKRISDGSDLHHQVLSVIGSLEFPLFR
jgi:hypothetical protein